MNIFNYLALFLCLFFSVIILVRVYHHHRLITGKKALTGRSPLYATIFFDHTALFPLIILISLFFIIFILVALRNNFSARHLYPFLWPFALCTFYHFILTLFMPLLRRFFKAQVCATLWIIPAAMIYVCCRMMFDTMSEDVFFINICLPFTLPDRIPGYFLIVWLVGFIFVILWKCISHLYFRRKILKDAAIVKDPDITALWLREMWIANFRTYSFLLMTSPETKTPLSIGLFRRSICVVLPEKQFTHDELKLIFRHELVHISQQHGMLKFFLMFCTALFWFNPLIWFTIRHCSEDLEVSCDEITMAWQSDEDRKKYADLLLTTVADERGFTTCLSASAKSLRYRLMHVLRPKRRLIGGILAGIVSFTLMFLLFFVNFSWNSGTAAKHVFKSDSADLYRFDVGYYDSGERMRYYEGADMQAITDYLSSLPVNSTSRSFTSDFYTCVQYKISGPDVVYRIFIGNEHLWIREFRGEKIIDKYFMLDQPTDFQLLESFMHTPKK